MGDPVHLAALMATQLLQGALIACLLALALRHPESGTARWRQRAALWAFFGTALMPLGAALPHHIVISFGPDRVFLWEGSAPIASAARASDALIWLCWAAVALWLAVAAARLGCTGLAVFRSERLARRSRRLPPGSFGLPADIRVAVSDEVAGPLVAGPAQPTIIVPARLLTEPGATLLVRHELAHVQRGDLGAALVQRVVEDLLWWNLPLRRIGRLLSEQHEMACDERAAQGGTSFARALLGEARGRTGPNHVLAVGLHGDGVGRRLDRLVRPPRRAALPLALIAASICFLAIGTTPRVTDSNETHVSIAAGS